jgi:1-acyl-sn-glycerol-3-phosphate acyltransferase
MFLTGIIPKVEFEQVLDRKGTYIFAPNHFSYLDILSVNVLIPVYFNFMAKHSLNKIPLFNIFFRTIDIPVDRASNKSSHRAFTKAGQRLQQGTSLLLFPEGKIGSMVPQMSHFKLGAFRLAIENGVPIVPVTILDNHQRMPDDGMTVGGSPGRMRIYVHKPLSVDGLTVQDARRLSEEVFNIINQKLKEASIVDKN